MSPDDTEGRGRASAEKARLRAQMRAWRAALPEAAWEEKSARIVGRLLALPEMERARTVHVFWPLVARCEPDTRPLIAVLHARGVRVVLPVVGPENPGAPPPLLHRVFGGADSLVVNRWGIAEPVGTPEVAPGELDVVIVPALTADRSGHRVGYGAGYYDAFLARTRATTVCPLFAGALVAHVPPEPHDRAVDVVVTEDEVVRVLA